MLQLIVTCCNMFKMRTHTHPRVLIRIHDIRARRVLVTRVDVTRVLVTRVLVTRVDVTQIDVREQMYASRSTRVHDRQSKNTLIIIFLCLIYDYLDEPCANAAQGHQTGKLRTIGMEPFHTTVITLKEELTRHLWRDHPRENRPHQGIQTRA